MKTVAMHKSTANVHTAYVSSLSGCQTTKDGYIASY